LIATNDEELETINRLISGSQQFDLFELQQEAEEIHETEVKETHARELSLKSAIEKNRCKKRKLVDPIEFALSLHHQALISYEPTMNWESEPVSEKQLKFLESLSFDTSMITTKGHASMILDTFMKRTHLKLATPKQVKFLIQLKHPSPHTCTFEQAKEFLTQAFG